MSGRERVHFVIHHAGDDVAMAVVPGITAGDGLNCWVMDRDIRLIISARDPIPLGHKIAVRDMPPGTRIVKYGWPIGESSTHIHAGEHVHLHNLRSLRW